MADIRINALPTTASASSSDDYIALDGTTNGTRKLNAYSPTFGGNLTVSGSTSIGSVFNMDAGNSTGTRTLQFGSTFNSGTFNFQNGLTTVMSITSGRVQFPATARTDDGGPTVPGWGFINDSGMGLYRVSANNLGFAINNANAATLNTTGLSLTGNFTVSGTGTSSVAGNWFIGTTTAAASGARLQAQLTGTDGTVSTLLSLRKNTNAAGTGVAIDFTPDSTDNPLAKLSAVRTSLVNGYTDFRFSTWNGSALAEQLRLVGQTGNLIIGSSFTDAGYKLQVNGTAAINGTFIVTGDIITASGYVFRSLGDAYLDSASTKSIYLRPAGTTALTLDSSQNATFAKGATINSGAADTRALRLTENGTRTLDFTVTSGATADINANIALRLFSAGTLALTLDSSQNATFAGNYVYIGGGTSFYLRATGSGNGLWYGNAASFDGNSFSFRNQAGTVTNHSFDSSKVFIANTQAVPATPTGGGHLYVEGGALKYKGSSGTVTTIANA